MADLELFERILIASDIRGGRGDKGEKGEQGPTADVTGQALYAASVEQGFPGTYDDWLREYLGAAVQTSLPWCSGYIQNMSIPAATPLYLTPIVTAGNESMINGVRFIAQTSGLYLLTAGGGRFASSIAHTSAILINSQSVQDNLETAAAISSYSDRSIGSHTVLAYLRAGDTLACFMWASASSPTFSQDGAVHRFTFAQLTKEAS